MAEKKYINVNMAKAQFTGNFVDAYTPSLIKALLNTVPAADVEPVRHGHWICIGDIDEYIFECSECHEIYCLNDGTPKEHQYNYCPNCGTKLCKGEENNA